LGSSTPPSPAKFGLQLGEIVLLLLEVGLFSVEFGFAVLVIGKVGLE